MRVAIVHYHFKPGGVTRVVENVAAALNDRAIELACISGEPIENDRLPPITVCEGLAYCNDLNAAPKDLGSRLLGAAKRAFGGHLPDIWHFHNHSLGKNAMMGKALRTISETGAPILLQIHDFAEDGRPENYETLWAPYGSDKTAFSEDIYPLASHIHYAALNGRDLGFLKMAGVPDDQLHRLGNPVAVPNAEPDEERSSDVKATLGADELILYPTRAIRRKNIGEMLLWASIANEGTVYASTMAPANPSARSVYEAWVQLAKALNLPARFEVGMSLAVPFPELISQSDAIITTSVGEGFGLAFLEPALFRKPLCGRDLPDITADFSEKRIVLNNLYERIDIPKDLTDLETLRSKLRGSLEAFYTSYRKDLPADAVEKAFSEIVADGFVEFGSLDEALQTQILKKVSASEQAATAIRRENKLMQSAPQAVDHNAERIASEYSLENYGEALADIYKGLTTAGVTRKPAIDSLNHEALLDCFLDPRRFRFLRS